MKIVLANGVFDLLHVGHLQHLEEARAMGDCLIVSLTVDDHVNKGPGRPIYTWDERAKLLRGLRCVHGVIPSKSSLDAIYRIRPAIFVKGIDYKSGWSWTEEVEKACKEVGAQLRFTSTPKYSATDTIKRVLELERAKI